MSHRSGGKNEPTDRNDRAPCRCRRRISISISWASVKQGWGGGTHDLFWPSANNVFYNNLAKCPKCFLGILAADSVLKEVNKLVTVSGQWATSNPWSAAKHRCKEHRPSQEAMTVRQRCGVGLVYYWWTTLTIHNTVASRENAILGYRIAKSWVGSRFWMKISNLFNFHPKSWKVTTWDTEGGYVVHLTKEEESKPISSQNSSIHPKGSFT